MQRRKRVGLALGGGVVRGFAHLGVLSVLDEAGIPVDCLSGTSAGSLIGACYCAGASPASLMERACNLHWWHLASLAWPKRGFLSFDKLANWIVQGIGDLDFSQLKIPCVIATTDLEAGVPVKLCQGNVARAVQASCSVPGFVQPVLVDGRWLCEGGITDMLPAGVLREMGAEYVIGVDVFAYKVRKWLGPFGYGIASLELALERSGGGHEKIDCLIDPDLKGRTYLRFSQCNELYELGRQAALAKVPEIHRAIGI